MANRSEQVRKKIPTPDGGHVNVRFQNQTQAMRIQLLIDYMNFVSNTSGKDITYEQLSHLLLEDFKFAVSQIEKINKELNKGNEDAPES